MLPVTLLAKPSRICSMDLGAKNMASPAPSAAPITNAIFGLIVTSTQFRVLSSGIERWVCEDSLYSLYLFVCSIRQSPETRWADCHLTKSCSAISRSAQFPQINVVLASKGSPSSAVASKNQEGNYGEKAKNH